METTDSSQTPKLWLLLTACLFIAFLAISLNPSWSPLIIYLAILIVSLYLLIKNKDLLIRNDFFEAILFSSLTALAVTPQMSFYYFVAFITFLAYLGAMATNRQYKGKIQLISDHPLKGLALTLVLASITSFINFVLHSLIGGNAPHFLFSLDNLIAASRFATIPGITEEILMHLIPYALVIQVLKTTPRSKKASFITYLIMILPHTLIHFHLSQMNPLNILVSTLLLGLCFGLPMAFLMRKVSLSSAILLHFLVDLIRYLIFQS
ncbi:hypothetical protein HZY91_01705 [Facklamia sp. DSM 111018]|uniref:CPBP family intramembrane metalloprotease n=1 Tax=Facklamia lactis TaxID=2749967 RepID=A0ABS0LQ34_9LACT|nr:hypothetical protein [Facklamia lactis]MBG9979715.1 hypothetical protein [Facklamia lactis]MBG9985605.1 hypothetical protein [Facklamia lactis]